MTSPQVGARKSKTSFPEAISNQPMPKLTTAHDAHPPSRPWPPDSCRTATLPLWSPSPEPSGRGGHPGLRDPPPQASVPAGPAVRGQGWGSGNPLAALGERARAKGLSKQRSHGAGGPATGVLSHPAATAGRRFTGNRKMCTSRGWNRRRDLRRKGVGGGRQS